MVSKYIIGATALVLSANANASLIWDWSFGGESGKFITDGSGFSAGTFNVTDFIVEASSAGATLGSWSGGQYDDTFFSNGSPYSFDWSGSSITALHSSQDNWSAWFTFEDLGTSSAYLFGWETGNFNTVTHAIYYDDNVGCCAQTSYVYSVTPGSASVVPVPAAVWLFGSGLLGLLWVARRKVRA